MNFKVNESDQKGVIEVLEIINSSEVSKKAEIIKKFIEILRYFKVLHIDEYNISKIHFKFTMRQKRKQNKNH